jgi:hypothetical protein
VADVVDRAGGGDLGHLREVAGLGGELRAGGLGYGVARQEDARQAARGHGGYEEQRKQDFPKQPHGVARR